MFRVFAAAAVLCAAPVAALAFQGDNPADVLAAVKATGGQAELAKGDNGLPMINVAMGDARYAVEFQGCDTTGKACALVSYRIVARLPKSVTVAQLNNWNRWALCPAVITQDGSLGLSYTFQPAAAATAGETKVQAEKWLGCINDFARFGSDYQGFLAGTGVGEAPTASVAQPG